MMSFTQKITIGAVLMCGLTASADELWLAGNVGNWNDIANWNNAVPAVGADINARARSGGTITMNSFIDTTGQIDIRLSDGAATAALTTLNWNPGSGSTAQFVERIIIGDTAVANAAFNHQSGTIRVDNDWFHIARSGIGTYTGHNNSSLTIDDRISIGQNGEAYAVLNDNSSLHTGSGNESFIAPRANGKGMLTLNDNSLAESRSWRIAGVTGTLGTVLINGTATLRGGANAADGQISLGYNGDATMIMNGGTVDLKDDTSLRVADNSGTSYLEMNGNARITGTGNGQGHIVLADGNTSVANMVMNNTSGVTDMRRMWISNNGGSQATLTMNDSSFLNFNRESRELILGNTGTAGGHLVMNDDSTVTTEDVFMDSNNNNGGASSIVQNQNSKITASGWIEYGGGNNDTSTWTLNDDAQLIATGAAGQLRIGTRANGTGVMTLNQNAVVIANQDGNETRVGSEPDSTGILNVNDNALFLANGNLVIGANNSGVTGTANQNGGTVQVNATLYIGSDGTSTGTYNLNGGTLKTDRIDIRGNGFFEWGAATLTMREPNRGANGNGIEIEVVGNNGNLATSAGSILDLGDVYISNGLNFDKLDMNGRTLDLTAAGDTLEIWRYVSAFRPGGSNTSATYEIKLINSPSILGEFDDVTGPGPDFQYFGVYSSAQVATLGLTPANIPRNRGFIDYRADGAYFVFNVAGQVPEPSTGIFLLFGTMLLRGVSVMRRNKRIRTTYPS